jgi:hypothetical protein
MLPILVKLAQSNSIDTAGSATSVAPNLLGQDWIARTARAPTTEPERWKDVEFNRKRLLNWWEHEGKAKYGRGK